MTLIDLIKSMDGLALKMSCKSYILISQKGRFNEGIKRKIREFRVNTFLRTFARKNPRASA